MRGYYLYPITITHRCGHIITRREGGTKESRDRLAARLRQQDCEDCIRFKGGREVLLVDDTESVLPALRTGSDAQIAWAVKIRRKFLTAMLENRLTGFNPVEWMQFLTDAKWWIDRRNLNPAELVERNAA